ncbi:MAG: hypothetical protein J7J30_00940 [Candidatus Odinarchaeota archaeon]|nr:hypothetical protein [Candidatus Odinarchaeota archaeon]
MKERLDKLRGESTWDEFFSSIIERLEREKRVKAAEKFLKKYKLSEKEAEKLIKFVEEGRRNWRFKTPEELEL